jgi:pimeloyl-ACP methyl ester carboxylesterase
MTADISSRFVDANGIRFEVHTAGSSDKLALCLHGFPENWYSWRFQIPLLVELGYEVWAPDLRGYGGTDKPRDVSEYRMDVLVQDVAGLIDAAGKKSVTVLAHDWGGAVAWEFMSRKLRPVDRFVAMNIPHPRAFARHLRKPFGPQLRRSWYILLFQLPRIPEWFLARHGYEAIGGAFSSMAVDKSRFPPEVLDHYKREAARPGAIHGMLAYYRAAIRHRAMPPGDGKIDAKSMIIWGEADTALGKETAEDSMPYLRYGTLRWIPNCSHWVQQEAPEKVNELLKAFLTDQEVPRFD